ncbi:MAG: hypothetical protein KIH08_05175 [Candidatus Freyarchaeota archaeon]|nr:hypothetical protein [Candidatus Jordarchaeia archaeon]MBS7268956.1 hypothetical protein [Candidatus Jordarchaeia archaeon]MBS7281122.1 hypothetical protein [Candidatus Jordarchaeia archaeon]
MQKLDQDVKYLLRDICRLILEIVFAIHSLDKNISSRVGDSFEKYEFGLLVETFQVSAEIVTKLVLLVEDYIDAIVKGLDLFSNLVLAFGIKNYSGILSQKSKLGDFINPDAIDLGFLKFQVRTTEELIYPQLIKKIKDMLEKMEDLGKVFGFLKSDVLNTFLEEIKKQKNDWEEIQKRLNLFFTAVEKEADVSDYFNQISRIIIDFALFGNNVRNLSNYLGNVFGDRLDFSLENVSVLFEVFRQLKQDLITLVTCRAKEAEHIRASFIKILAILWDSEEEAGEKFQSYLKSEIKLDDLIPPSFSLEDLEFGMVQSRNEILLVEKIHKRVKENIESVRKIAGYLNSPVLREQYEITLKEIEIVDKYWPKYTQKIIELQNLLHNKRKT